MKHIKVVALIYKFLQNCQFILLAGLVLTQIIVSRFAWFSLPTMSNKDASDFFIYAILISSILYFSLPKIQIIIQLFIASIMNLYWCVMCFWFMEGHHYLPCDRDIPSDILLISSIISMLLGISLSVIVKLTIKIFTRFLRKNI
jgi:hypothetical protein